MITTKEIKEMYNKHMEKHKPVETKKTNKIIKKLERKIYRKVNRFKIGMKSDTIFKIVPDITTTENELLYISEYFKKLGFYTSITRENKFTIVYYISWSL